ncbi:DUF1289 domain-containing protein [Halopseudomonas pachastrellae]|nr:DUF1289 domain-containing protein [Halopseudomonas pachastrellae]
MPPDSDAYTSKTPCIGLCSTVFGDLVCRGCKRFSHEIIDWNRYDNGQRAAVWSRLEQLLEQLIWNRFELVSVGAGGRTKTPEGTGGPEHAGVHQGLAGCRVWPRAVWPTPGCACSRSGMAQP